MIQNSYVIKTGLRNKSALQVYLMTKVVLKRMDGNPHFPDSGPYIERLTVCSQELGLILKQNQGTTLHLVKRNDAKQKAEAVLRNTALYVYAKSAGDIQIMLSSGYGVRCKKTKTKLRPAPKIKRTEKVETGTVKFLWQADILARTYNVYLAEAAQPENRRRVATVTKSSTVIKGLESGKKYLLWVSAVNTAGESPLSNAITVCEAWA